MFHTISTRSICQQFARGYCTWPVARAKEGIRPKQKNFSVAIGGYGNGIGGRGAGRASLEGGEGGGGIFSIANAAGATGGTGVTLDHSHTHIIREWGTLFRGGMITNDKIIVATVCTNEAHHRSQIINRSICSGLRQGNAHRIVFHAPVGGITEIDLVVSTVVAGLVDNRTVARRPRHDHVPAIIRTGHHNPSKQVTLRLKESSKFHIRRRGAERVKIRIRFLRDHGIEVTASAAEIIARVPSREPAPT